MNMNSIGTSEIVGIGAVALAVIAAAIKIFQTLVNVIEHNAKAMEQLSNNVGKNTEATNQLKEQSASTKGAMDRFTETLIQSQLRK